MIGTVGDVLLVGCFVAAAVFVVRYAFVRWEDTRDGVHMMLFMGVVLLILGTAVATLVLSEDHPVWPYVRAVDYGALLTVLVWRDWLLFQAQRRKQDERERDLEGRASRH